MIAELQTAIGVLKLVPEAIQVGKDIWDKIQQFPFWPQGLQRKWCRGFFLVHLWEWKVYLQRLLYQQVENIMFFGKLSLFWAHLSTPPFQAWLQGMLFDSSAG